ncbi:hypothetical protein FISHEDRAFT_55052 [Fistulina hepatica ATCC 64428]|uniref:START domain-containing protein n=1 Tax=Fistulina hepatica ATCC 64428 TaxID=1128425 RepID=A0A0D7AS24_9AGAR|nr:hypothetical protein FISHEDRAFT_55052 [Fistulina hepatica ATCC 64428]
MFVSSPDTRLKQTWLDALDESESFLRLLLSSPSSEWRRLSLSNDKSSLKKGKARATSVPELDDVVVHRKTSKHGGGGDIYRLILDVPISDESSSLDAWQNVLATPELRQEWDPAVEDACVVETLDQNTRVVKTNFTLGWPANPRDAVTISRTIRDASTVIEISTSPPHSPNEPIYLRPSPPYVRSHVDLFVWCIQKDASRIRMTCYWQHQLHSVWILSTTTAIAQQLATMTLGLLRTVIKRRMRIPRLCGVGMGIALERVRFQVDREMLTVDYAVVPDEPDSTDIDTLREQRRLMRTSEWTLPSTEGWDVQLSVRASSEEVESLPWSARASRAAESQQLTLRVKHTALTDSHSVLKVRVVIERSGPTSGWRLNGVPQPINQLEERNPSGFCEDHGHELLHDVASAADVSLYSPSSMSNTNHSSPSTTISVAAGSPLPRSEAARRAIIARVKRKYIYFSSLLQEPEAKWKQTTETRGVSVTQLDSIDPTLVVYRAEATFVGIGMWDLFSVLTTPGTREQAEEAVLLEDINELTQLWHYKFRTAWPANARDCAVLKTVYKSPTAIHVFAFSAEDAHLFPNIPPPDPNIIRMQIDLQGFAIEALSPNTTQITLLEQSDPKGWTNKASTPTQMIAMIADIGDFVIKNGSPPVLTRLAGAKATEMRYDHDKSTFRVQYEMSGHTKSASSSGDNEEDSGKPSPAYSSAIECELRCDVDTWAGSLDIVVDPPPQSISCLRRHRFSSSGGGLWLTLSHDSGFLNEEPLLTMIRKGPGREKGLVSVNGARIHVDTEDLSEHEIRSLAKRPRVKPPRIPLDQPPVMSAIQKKRAEWNLTSAVQTPVGTPTAEAPSTPAPVAPDAPPSATSPFARFFATTMDQASIATLQTFSAFLPSAAGAEGELSSSLSPMEHALKALAWAQESHSRFTSDGWAAVNDKGLKMQRKLSSDISTVVPVYKGEKVIEGFAADELATVISDYDSRPVWDSQFSSALEFESFGFGCRTSFIVAPCGFPFRDRGFYIASVTGRAQLPSAGVPLEDVAERSSDLQRNAIFLVSASFHPQSVESFSATKYNPRTLPIGRVFIDAWILETLDPYTKESYMIPSTRCVRLVAVDYAGSIPSAMNSTMNTALLRTILSLEIYMKEYSPPPVIRLPTSSLVLIDKKTDDIHGSATWRLRRRDEVRTLISSRFSGATKEYTCVFLLVLPAMKPQNRRNNSFHTSPKVSRTARSQSPSRSQESQTTERPGSANSSSATLSVGEPETKPSTRSSTSSPVILPSSISFDPVSSGASVDAPISHGRSASSAFTPKGEYRPTQDLLVAELVIDTKCYDAGYIVEVRSESRASCAFGRDGQCVPLVMEETENVQSLLPFNSTMHAMPSSPMHSSGLNSQNSTRQLLRLTLPTAQYQISTVKDPLTGEVHSAPPAPQWLLDLENGGAVVSVSVKPVLLENGQRSNDDDLSSIRIGDRNVKVVDERESLTSLGRTELLEDRVAKMSVLIRGSNPIDAFPIDLRHPVAVASDLVDPLITVPETPEVLPVEAGDDNVQSSDNETYTSGKTMIAKTEDSSSLMPNSSRRGLFSFLPTPILEWTTNGSSPSPSPGPPSRRVPGAFHHSSPPTPSSGVATPDDQHPASTTVLQRPRTYTMSSLILVALMAFLMGSLLRSLLSPADYIYIAADVERAAADLGQEGGGQSLDFTGWREIKRLIELKYIFGGYDLQVALI